MSGQKIIYGYEKRKEVRYKEKIECNLRFKSPSTNEDITERVIIKDLSETGIAIKTKKLLPNIHFGHLEILLPDPYKRVEIEGRVVWEDKDNISYGFQFITLDPDPLKILNEYSNRTTLTRTLKILIDRRGNTRDRRIKSKTQNIADIGIGVDRRKFRQDRRKSSVPKSTDKNYSKDFVAARRGWLAKRSQASLEHIGHISQELADFKGNIENLIGVCHVPLGIAGPLRINGQYAQGDFYIPLATTEGALVMTYHRGAEVISKSGGANTLIIRDETHISPIFLVKNVSEGTWLIEWIKNSFNGIKTEVEKTTKHGKLLNIDAMLMGRNVVVKFSYFTGDAQGLNMINRATDAACKYISKKTKARYFHRSNFSSIKKVSSFNIHKGQGKAVFAEVIVPRKVLRLVQTTPEDIYELYVLGLSSGVYAGMVGQNAHIANAIAALYIACGQDVADVSASQIGITTFGITEDKDLYASVYLPNVFAGTVGGGTGLATQKECLQILGCYGSGQARKFAEIVGATALAGEIAVMAALVNNTYVDAHEKYGRNRPEQIQEE